MNVAAVILAAGKGTRMGNANGSEIPKVMFCAHNKPLIEYSVNNVRNAGIDRIVLVVGYKRELVQEHFGNQVEYANQEEQLGTGHAAKMARPILEGAADAVVVCYGDMPLFKDSTIRNLIEKFESEKPTIAMLTVEFEDPEFWAFGRIVRDENGKITAIIEQKDCSEEQKKICESNPGFYIFDGSWLWDALERIGSNNSQHEYYLTDLIAMAIESDKKVVTSPVEEENEVMGVNTPEQLQKVEEIMNARQQ